MSRIRCRFLSVVALAIIFPNLPVSASDCADGSGDVAIATCTSRIKSGKFGGIEQAKNYYNRGYEYDEKSDYDLAISDYTGALKIDPTYTKAYFNRGLAFVHKGDYDRGIADYNQAIKLNPKDPEVFNNRGNAYDDRGDYDLAIADYNQTISLNPKYALAYRNRGRVNLYAGALSKALADVNQANALDPKNPYTALWVEIVGQRNNLPSRLSQTRSQVDMTEWPAPVIGLFLGQTTTDAVLAAADDRNVYRKKGQVCAANFYSGELSLMKGAKDEATRLFRLAANGCPRSFMEWTAAKAELKALGAAP
jgi:lipoprotein NlpI